MSDNNDEYKSYEDYQNEEKNVIKRIGSNKKGEWIIMNDVKKIINSFIDGINFDY